ncbi:hypothetical protein HDU67_005368 [Dinochytrium kinnereticum]|nr:hypothetical protein HDU67_005368 [Dinochytrium kinnereticum]
MAKETVKWCVDHPSLKSLQALLLLNASASSLKDMSSRSKFRNMAFRMCRLPNDLGKDSIMDCLLSFSEVLYEVKQSVTVLLNNPNETISQKYRSGWGAEGLLSEWRYSLPPCLDMDSEDIWTSSEIISSAPPDIEKVTLYLGYHACMCLIYHARAIATDALSSDPKSKSLQVALKSATTIATTTQNILSMKSFQNSVCPLSGYCVLVSALVLCDMCGRMIEGWEREELTTLIVAEMVFLKGLSSHWKMTEPWFDMVKKEVEKLTAFLDL